MGMNKILVVLFLVFTATVGETVEIDIRGEKRVEKKFVITIIPFHTKEGAAKHNPLAEEMDKILENDLTFSGFFYISPHSYLIDEISALDRQAGQIHFYRWTETGSQFLVYPQFSIDGKDGKGGKNFTLSIKVYEIASGSLFFNVDYKGPLSDLRKLIHRVSDEVLFRFTGERGPFETRIAYISSFRGIKEIFTCDYDGKNSKAVTNHATISLSPAWAPADPILAYTSYRYNNADLLVNYLITGQEKLFAQYPGLNAAPAWSPDGAHMACSLSRDGNSEIYTIRLTDKGLKRLTYHRAIDTSPTWDPESSRIAFCSDRSGSPQIYIMSSDGGDVRRISYRGRYNTTPDWSPRGDKIAYVSRLKAVFQIVIYDVRKKRSYQLTQGVANCENPSWSPDGRYIVYDSTLTGKKQLYLINVNGKNRTSIKFGSIETYDPAWSPIYK